MLWNDLSRFHFEHYCASRMCLVVKAVTKDKMEEVKSWVENYFNFSSTKNLPRQNFAEIAAS